MGYSAGRDGGRNGSMTSSFVTETKRKERGAGIVNPDEGGGSSDCYTLNRRQQRAIWASRGASSAGIDNRLSAQNRIRRDG